MANTKTPVDELAGRELDYAIAEEVFDCNVVREDWHGTTCGCENRQHAEKKRVTKAGAAWKIHRYSTDIAAAWEVVEAMDKAWTIAQDPAESDWIAGPTGWEGVEGGSGVWSETAPLAICRAALKAVRQA